jgi:hypothetical protein
VVLEYGPLRRIGSDLWWGRFSRFFGGLFRVEDGRVIVRQQLAWLALGFFGAGFGMIMLYETHLLPGWSNLFPW